MKYSPVDGLLRGEILFLNGDLLHFAGEHLIDAGFEVLGSMPASSAIGFSPASRGLVISASFTELRRHLSTLQPAFAD